ncbi:protein CsiD [Endozoicomonas montiporae]|uniref:Protein CsiD n=2 Tax=Endozoicomonas montiporae TaxID=1027273 RepID=A0A081NAT5_9GAMM|nr:glutarate dioxygenase GlaH [Endozoicomonas montiporae]AMO56747.1 protein CsiD [Endozoicomonas montiporae CL-33]KEQ15558.1 protein CsiD [Endozoicomonas montiporae]
MVAVTPLVQTAIEPLGYTLHPYPDNHRLQVITLQKETIDAFKQATEQWNLQAVEYKPFLRFAIADQLDRVCNRSLSSKLNGILSNRETGAFLLQYDSDEAKDDTEFHIKLSTAVSHLIGVPNFDAMYGKYYACFAVENKDDSDSYLRQAHRRMELHNDGTYVDERTDFVLMMKLAERNVQGGESLLLHMDDWEELEQFYQHPLASESIEWASPPSKNIDYKVSHPVFFEKDANGRPMMLFIDQFADPQNMDQGMYLYAMGESLEKDPNCFAVTLPPGSMLVIQNHIWLHGRDRFMADPGLYRELLRQRGHFYK